MQVKNQSRRKSVTLAQIITAAKPFIITVEAEISGSVELLAPDGYSFSPGLHALVSAPWDLDTDSDVLHSAMEDLKTNGPLLEKCSDDCDCKE